MIGLGSLALWFLMGELNHWVAPWQISFYLAGLFLTFGFIRLPLQQGLLHTSAIALWLDASSPHPLGLGLFLFLFLHLTIYSMRYRFPSDETSWNVFIAFLVNLIAFLTLSLWHAGGHPSHSLYWLRCLSDLLASQILLILLAPWFFALQQALAQIGPWSRRDEAPSLS